MARSLVPVAAPNFCTIETLSHVLESSPQIRNNVLSSSYASNIISICYVSNKVCCRVSSTLPSVFAVTFLTAAPILEILGALERGAQGAFNAPKNFKIGPTVKKLQHQRCA